MPKVTQPLSGRNAEGPSSASMLGWMQSGRHYHQMGELKPRGEELWCAAAGMRAVRALLRECAPCQGLQARQQYPCGHQLALGNSGWERGESDGVSVLAGIGWMEEALSRC